MSWQMLADYIQQHPRLLVISGAGLSTESGIGDYRNDQGQYKRPPPMTISEFVATHHNRQRYWARSLFGWPAFAAAKPNAGHLALARLQANGYLAGGLITQNVDHLHQQAGHQAIVSLHGQLAQVCCLQCGVRFSRALFHQELLRCNSQFAGEATALLPDGDAELSNHDVSQLVIPNCRDCGGVLKPDVVFFGDAVQREVVQHCYALVAAADALLVVGSSVMVYSSYRFCRRAHELGLSLAALNKGATRADDWYQFKLALPCGSTLTKVADSLAGPIQHPGDAIA